MFDILLINLENPVHMYGVLSVVAIITTLTVGHYIDPITDFAEKHGLI